MEKKIKKINIQIKQDAVVVVVVYVYQISILFGERNGFFVFNFILIVMEWNAMHEFVLNFGQLALINNEYKRYR